MVASGNSTVNIIDIQTLLVSLAAVFWDVTQSSLWGNAAWHPKKKRLQGRLYSDAFKESCFLIVTERVEIKNKIILVKKGI